MSVTYIQPDNRGLELLVQALMHKHSQDLQKEDLKIRQQQLKLQQDEAAQQQQMQQAQQGQALQALVGAFQGGGPAVQQAALPVVQNLANANVRPAQYGAEAQAAMAPATLQNPAGGNVANALQAEALTKFDQAKSVGEILRLAKAGGLGQYETDTAVNNFVKTQAAQVEADAQQKFVASLSPEQQRAYQVFGALKQAGLSGENFDNAALTFGVKPNVLQRVRIAQEQASAASSRASAAHSYALVKQIKDRDQGQRVAAARLGETQPVPGVDYVGMLEAGAKEKDPQTFLNRAAITFASQIDITGKPVWTPDEVAGRAAQLAQNIYPGVQIDLGHAAKVAQFTSQAAAIAKANAQTKKLSPDSLRTELAKIAKTTQFALTPAEFDSVFTSITKKP